MTHTERPAKTTGQRQPRQASQAPRAERPLSPTGAFVVQFREEPEGAGNRFAGRAEHVTSGQAARFESPEDLLAFLVRVLRGGKRSARTDTVVGTLRRPA